MDEMKEARNNNSDKMEVSENISFLTFATERQKEILAMTNSISNPSTTKLIFQKLPPQMRRRVMSHNSKRLPIRLRDGHMNQLTKSGLPPPSKRPSRCYRRRPNNLTLEYRRRQKTNMWLETHIWHAKRFHMSERWGFKLPEAPCDKSLRAAFRASSAHCLLQDSSYNICIELTGKQNHLLTKLKNITNQKFGLTFAAKAFLSGAREGAVEIIHIDFPHNAIGKINFLWNPITNKDLRKLWMFIHPSYYNEVLELLIELFNLHGYKNEEMHDHKINANADLLEYCNDEGINLNVIKDLNRFTLTGPLSNAILRETLKELNLPLEQCKRSWACEYFNHTDETEIYKKQANAWNLIKHTSVPSDINSHIVLGLNIQDPRLLENGTYKRTKAIPGNASALDLNELSENLSHSVLWDSEIRKQIKDNMVSNGELCKLRSKLNLVPGENGNLIKYLQAIPIILIQNPGIQNGKLGYGAGWDVIIPPGYAMPMWISFIMKGARAGGLREARNICFESQRHYLLPDTVAGKCEAMRIYNELKTKYFKLPPAKRVNYIKIGINSPFKCHWQLLINEWASTDYEYFKVLREIHLLKDLQLYIENKLSSIIFEPYLNYLVPVSVHMLKRGMCKDFAIICLPDFNDMKIYKNKEYTKILIENKHRDENEDKRRNERLVHLALLKRLKRKRILARKTVKASEQSESNNKWSSESLVRSQLEKMRQLWLPEKITTVRNQCSREVMGYVTYGGFSFIQHSGMCLGFVALNSLIILRSKYNKNVVLVRNTTSKKYSFALINIIH